MLLFLMRPIDSFALMFIEWDKSWWDDGAACRGWLKDNPGRPTPWNVASNDPPVGGIPAHKLVDYALLVCSSCPAQYGCARHAVTIGERAGTWAMRIRELLWLQHQDDAEEIIATAERLGDPVRVHVRAARAERQAALVA